MMHNPYQLGDVMISLGAYIEYYDLRPEHDVFKVPDGLSGQMVALVNYALAQVIYGLQRIGLSIRLALIMPDP